MSSKKVSAYTEGAKKAIASPTLQKNLTNLQERFGKGAMKLWEEMEDPAMRDRVKESRMRNLAHLDIVLAELSQNIRKRGGKIYFASTAQDAIDYTLKVASAKRS